VRVTYLTEDDQIDLTDFSKVTFASWKYNIKGHEAHDYPLSTSYDIFSSAYAIESDLERKNSEEFTIISTDLFDCDKSDSTLGYSHETNPEFKVDFLKDKNSVGYVGTKNKIEYISYSNLRVDITYQSSFGIQINEDISSIS